MEKRYVSNRWPYLKIHFHDVGDAAFEGGLFVTDDPALQAKIEAHGDYGIHIHPQDYMPPPPEEAPAAEPEATLVIGSADEGGPEAEAEPSRPAKKKGKKQ